MIRVLVLSLYTNHATIDPSRTATVADWKSCAGKSWRCQLRSGIRYRIVAAEPSAPGSYKAIVRPDTDEAS